MTVATAQTEERWYQQMYSAAISLAIFIALIVAGFQWVGDNDDAIVVLIPLGLIFAAVVLFAAGMAIAGAISAATIRSYKPTLATTWLVSLTVLNVLAFLFTLLMLVPAN